MKKVVIGLIILVFLVGMSGADITPNQTTAAITHPKNHCVGYTIIEFGKAIDCHGDTIRLVKVKGGQAQMR